jgi:hypothetical protein
MFQHPKIVAAMDAAGYAPGATVTLYVTYWPDTITVTATEKVPGFADQVSEVQVGLLDSFMSLVISDTLHMDWHLVSNDGIQNAVYTAVVPSSITYVPEMDSITFDKPVYTIGDTATMTVTYAALKATVTVTGSLSRPDAEITMAETVFEVGHNQMALVFTDAAYTWTSIQDDGYGFAQYQTTIT